jgi:hypothetical protein
MKVVNERTFEKRVFYSRLMQGNYKGNVVKINALNFQNDYLFWTPFPLSNLCILKTGL